MTRAVEIVGHRGARGLFPENTIDGFREAFDLGVRTFELDVGMTADGVVVVSHDLALNPAITRDGSGRFLSGTPPLIHALPWSELCRFDVGRIRSGSPYRLAHCAQQPNDGARVPRLADVLREVPGARLVIELKTDPRYPERTVPAEHLADAVLAIVDAAGAAERVIVESFDWRGPLHIRRIRPHMRWHGSLVRKPSGMPPFGGMGSPRKHSVTACPRRSRPRAARCLGISGPPMKFARRGRGFREPTTSGFAWSRGPSTDARRCAGCLGGASMA